MKTCNMCHEPKPPENFDKNRRSKDGLTGRCKACQKIYWQNYISNPDNLDAHRARNRVRARRLSNEAVALVRSLKENKPCTDCGVSYPHYVMDFDHIRDKTICVGTLQRQAPSKDRLLEEIAKCELVCSNCHRIRTHRRMVETRSKKL